MCVHHTTMANTLMCKQEHCTIMYSTALAYAHKQVERSQSESLDFHDTPPLHTHSIHTVQLTFTTDTYVHNTVNVYLGLPL